MLGGVLVKLVVDEEIALDAVDGAPCVRVGLGDLAEAPADGWPAKKDGLVEACRTMTR